MRTVTAYLALGSNLGDSRANIRSAVKMLQGQQGVTVTAASSLYRSRPVGVPDQPDFLNAVVSVETRLRPRDLLAVCQKIELDMGRKRTMKWGPRVIDLDILLYGDCIINEDGLRIPHPHMTERDFVLVPLAEIAPDLTLPGGVPVLEAAAALGKSDIAVVEDCLWCGGSQ